MSRIMHGILIDPEARACEVVQLDTDNLLTSIYEVMRCSCVEEVRFDFNGDVVLVDEEGLFKKGLRSFFVPGHGQPLFGRALIVGSADDQWTAPKTPFIEAINAVRWDPQFETGKTQQVVA